MSAGNARYCDMNLHVPRYTFSDVILSDVYFRRFEQYLDVKGLDMAIVGDSDLYHMRKVGSSPLAQYLTIH